MAAICNPSCDEQEIRSYCTPCDRITATRKGAINQIGLFKCESSFTDVTDADEWVTLIESGGVILIPEGVGEIVEPDQTTDRISACKGEEVTGEISGLNFQLKLFDNDAYTDFDLEYDLKNKIGNYTLFFIDCNGLLYINYNWTTGENAGFGNLSSTVTRQFPTDGLQLLQINFRFDTYKSGYRGIPLTPAIATALSAACSEPTS